MDTCRCSKEKEIATLQSETKTLFKNNEDMKDEIKNMNKVYNLIYDLTSNVSVLTTQMVRMNEDISNIQGDVEDIKKQPASDYNHYKKLMAGAIITAVIGAFLAGKFL